MAYPASVISFTTKNAGDTIQPAHVNDLQTDVTAIEDGLLNGLAHQVIISTGGLTVSTGSVNIGGPSSLATLQVNGASTFAGPVTFSSAVTFGGPHTFSSGLTVSTGVIRQNSLPAWNVFHSTHSTVASGSSIGALFDSQDFVRGDIGHSTGVNSSRITINTTGLYHLDYQSVVATPAGAVIRAYVQLNDVTPLLSQHQHGDANAGIETIRMTGLVRMASTGYLTVVMVSSNGVSTHGSSAVADAARFMGYFVG